MASNLTAAIAAACDLKQQMNDHILYVDGHIKRGLYTMLDQPEAFDREKRDMGKVLTRQYAPAIRAIVDASTLDDLTERRERLNRTLHKGWTYCALHPSDEAAHEAWEARLLEYSVIEDAINHVGIINGVLDRIGHIESFVQPMEQRSLV